MRLIFRLFSKIGVFIIALISFLGSLTIGINAITTFPVEKLLRINLYLFTQAFLLPQIG